MSLSERPRRNRRSPALRGAVRETRLHADQFVYPVFVHDEKHDTPIASLPSQTRWSIAGLTTELRRCLDLGVNKFALFPKIDDALKTPAADEALNPDGLIPRTLRHLKQNLPESGACLIADPALDPYNADGHDGLVTDQGTIDNDATVDLLAKVAVLQANAGADVIAPSDMMDGRVAAIRHALDDAHHTDVAILSYTAKYASAFYGPFRGALDSAPRQDPKRNIPADKATYQMDPANRREARREAALDQAQGADILMVKPAGPYLDVLHDLRQRSDLPLAAYQVSGEYLMIKAAAQSQWLDERQAVLESLIGIRRAGADLTFTYFAPQVAAWLAE